MATLSGTGRSTVIIARQHPRCTGRAAAIYLAALVIRIAFREAFEKPASSHFRTGDARQAEDAS